WPNTGRQLVKEPPACLECGAPSSTFDDELWQEGIGLGDPSSSTRQFPPPRAIWIARSRQLAGAPAVNWLRPPVSSGTRWVALSPTLHSNWALFSHTASSGSVTPGPTRREGGRARHLPGKEGAGRTTAL